MNEREIQWATKLCERSKQLLQLSQENYDDIESFFSYQLAKDASLTPCNSTIEGDGWALSFNSNGGVDKNQIKKLEVVSTVSDTAKIGEEQMKYLTKRSDGRWQGRKIINEKRVCVYGATQLECKEKLRIKEKKHKKEPCRDSFYKFSLWWLETYKLGNIAESTRVGYKSTINAHLKIATPINKVTLIQLQVLVSALPNTRIREEVFKLIRQIMRKAYELDVIKKDISQFLDKGKIQRAENRALNLKEQTALLSALSGDMFSRRVLLFLVTGCRPGEISTIDKKELRPNYIKINGTKTSGSVRWVKVSDKIVEMVKNESPEFFKFNGKRFREHLQNFCNKIGIEYEVTIYTLRHTFATNLYIIGVPEKDRQVYMGHKEGSKITNDVYTTFSPDVKKEDIYNIYDDLLAKF